MRGASMGNSSDSEPGPVIWLLVGGAATLALYHILKKKDAPGETQAADVPPIEHPFKYESFGAIASRFDEIRELYRMGYLTPDDTLSEIDRMIDAVTVLQIAERGERASALALLARMEEFRQGVAEFGVLAA
jgi:hypothetical protein